MVRVRDARVRGRASKANMLGDGEKRRREKRMERETFIRFTCITDFVTNTSDQYERQTLGGIKAGYRPHFPLLSFRI